MRRLLGVESRPENQPKIIKGTKKGMIVEQKEEKSINVYSKTSENDKFEIL